MPASPREPTPRLVGRVAVVTGASRGIGAAIARRLAAEGAHVAITARTAEAHDSLDGSLRETLDALQRGPGGGRAVAIVADLADADDRARVLPEAVAALGPVDILVNNAAAAIYRPPSEMALRHRRLLLEVNLHAPIDLALAALPSMRERGAGWIVNVSSGAARPVPGPPYAESALGSTTGHYGASKAALNRATNALAVEVANSGVRVNTIEPRAAVRSPGLDALTGDQLAPDLFEPMEAMVEATLALCDCGPERTGRNEVSLDLLAELGREIRTLDGTGPYVAEPAEPAAP